MIRNLRCARHQPRDEALLTKDGREDDLPTAGLMFFAHEEHSIGVTVGAGVSIAILDDKRIAIAAEDRDEPGLPVVAVYIDKSQAGPDFTKCGAFGQPGTARPCPSSAPPIVALRAGGVSAIEAGPETGTGP
ncbi:hypothetical protein LB543_31770 [Mesorhizobium sp. ESP7-2]|uniref:hypothetical protein n=1 Tax=Mesorhizobium sp. ESP7-2 TaxID=2876622 RepID=UPI001CCA8182|nr:hypothetical protein [Mesorhizobium sp. ESP7-2]MBZ9711279.1 hypothetical protein [Mesorhizobium sp. ESP7-2]